MMNLTMRKSIMFVFTLFLGITMSAQEKSAASLYNEGLKLLKAKDYEAGLPILESALAKATESNDEKIIGLAKKNGAKAAYNLANSKKKAGAHDEAIDLYNKGIEWSPEYASNYKGVAAALEAKGEIVEAIKQYIVAGDKTTASGKADKAAKLYKKAQNMVGKIYQAKDYEGAVTAGKAFLKLNDNAEVAYYICRAITESSISDEAITFADKAITFSGDTVNDKYFVAKAKAYEKLGNNAGAIEAYKLVTGEKYKEQAEYKIKTLGSR